MQTKMRKLLGIHSNSKINSRSTGFTLIELLVVIAIIGFLAAVVMSSLQAARERALDAQIKSDLSQMRNALELYAIDNGYTYPAIPVAYQESEANLAIDDFRYTRSDSNGYKTSVLNSMDFLKGLVVKSVYAQTPRPQNCSNFVSLSASLVPNYIGSLPQHPLDSGGDVCYQYFANENTAVVYAPLVTETYDNNGFSKQAGIVLGVTDTPALTTICQQNRDTNTELGATPFPLFSGGDRCSGTIADLVLGVENGSGEIASTDSSCSIPEYETESECEMDRSSCSDSQYTSAGQTVCEEHGTTSGGSCSGGNGAYTDEPSCENAGYYDGEGCNDGSGTYTNQNACEQAQCETAPASCSGGSYSTQSECETAGYTAPSCSDTSFGNQTDCESAQCELSAAYCSDGIYSDRDTCVINGYEWFDASYGSCGYYWNPGSPAYGYQWTPATYSSCGYSWSTGTWTPYYYQWTDGEYTPNVWTSQPGGTWGVY
ncbi:MAG: ral secretion pathway protein [Patescibacteria group bacterium]|nr:ral secretion pathway protein [Patescibacteria group bacterium]